MKQWENITIHGPNILFKNIMVYPIIFPSNIIINSLYPHLYHTIPIYE